MYLLDGELDVTIGGHRFRNRGCVPARSLAIQTPVGFDAFVSEAGTPLEECISGVAASDEQFRRVAALATSFGIELLKPPVQE